MIKTRLGKSAGVFFVLMMLFASIFQTLPLKAADTPPPDSKISSLLSLRTKIKNNYLKTGSVPQGTIILPGGNIQVSRRSKNGFPTIMVNSTRPRSPVTADGSSL